jgi:hypothetical protein
VPRCICLLSAHEGSYRDRHASFTVNGLTDMAPTIKPAQALNAIINVGDQDRPARCGYAGPRVERDSPFGILGICVRLHGLAFSPPEYDLPGTPQRESTAGNGPDRRTRKRCRARSARECLAFPIYAHASADPKKRRSRSHAVLFRRGFHRSQNADTDSRRTSTGAPATGELADGATGQARKGKIPESGVNSDSPARFDQSATPCDNQGRGAYPNAGTRLESAWNAPTAAPPPSFFAEVPSFAGPSPRRPSGLACATASGNLDP